MRFLYYCNSAYQLLNAISLHYSRTFDDYENIENYSGDLLILDVFKGVSEIVNILKENRIFSKVYIGNRVYKQGKFHIINNIKDIVFPSDFIYKANGIEKEEIYNKYDYIVVPKFSTITAAIWKMNKNAKLHIYEDGLGIYANNISLNPNSSTYKLLYKSLNYGRSFNDYEYLYLNEPSLCASCEKTEIKKIPRLDSQTLNNLSEMFKDFSFNIKDNKKVIWFDQYVEGEINNITRETLQKYRKDVVYCTHPRHPKNYSEFDTPNEKQIWELACLGIRNLNSKCLLTIYSTAVFTPKILYNFEPYIIFTIKLSDDYKAGKLNKYIDVIEIFKEMYDDKSKIFIPNTIKELNEYLANFINKK